MQQHGQTLKDLDIRVLVVTFESGAFARAYAQETGLGWAVMIDETRSLYEAYGMLRGRLRDIWGPRTWWAYAQEALRGRWPGPARADTSQLGGDVLIDPEGVVRLVHVGSGPADRPSIESLLEIRRHGPPAETGLAEQG